MAIFPTDVIADILCLLPVKSLARFKCVSKPWGSLIDNSEFAKFHLHHSFKTNTNHKLLLNDGSWYASVDFDSMDNMVELTQPFSTEGSSTRIFGSCNGLLAVYHEANIALWNPSTRICHHLPKLSIADVEKGDYNILGFGYDVMRDDYVVVVMILIEHRNRLVMIYSLKTNSWRKIKDCPYKFPKRTWQDGAYVNGSLHWYTRSLIFGLDLGVEEYHEIPDDKINSREFDYMHVGALGGSLCVSRDYDDCYQVWVMKEYAAKESWTGIITELGPGWEGNTYYRALAYSRRGDQILLDDGGEYRPAWWHLKRGQGEKLCIPGAPTRYNATTYVESLVSVLPNHH